MASLLVSEIDEGSGDSSLKQSSLRCFPFILVGGELKENAHFVFVWLFDMQPLITSG